MILSKFLFNRKTTTSIKNPFRRKGFLLHITELYTNLIYNYMNDYYLYAFLDPRKPGLYTYGEYSFEFEPFYIGKGIGKRIKQHYNPAELQRNNLKSTKIKAIRNANLKPIEQFLIGNALEIEVLEKEVELIATIGRFDKKKGPLTNMTDGGDGVSGYIATEELKRVRSLNGSGEKNSFYGKKHILSSTEFMSRKVYQIDRDTNEIVKEYPSIASAARETKANESHIRDCCKGNRKTHHGFKWQYVDNENIPTKKWNSSSGTKKSILQLDFDTEEVIREWDSISDAARFFDIRRQNIIKALTGWVKSCSGFKWKYKD